MLRAADVARNVPATSLVTQLARAQTNGKSESCSRARCGKVDGAAGLLMRVPQLLSFWANGHSTPLGAGHARTGEGRTRDGRKPHTVRTPIRPSA